MNHSSMSESPKDRNSIEAFEVSVKDGRTEDKTGAMLQDVSVKVKRENITGYN